MQDLQVRLSVHTSKNALYGRRKVDSRVRERPLQSGQPASPLDAGTGAASTAKNCAKATRRSVDFMAE